MAWTFGRASSGGVDGVSAAPSVVVNSGEKLIVVATVSDAPDTPAAPTRDGQTFTLGRTYAGTDFTVSVWYLINPNVGTAALSITSMSGDWGWMYQVWAADGAVTFDKTADVADDSSPVSGSLTTAQAAELILGFWADDVDSAAVRTVQASSTERIDALAGSGAGDYGQYSASRVGGAAGAHTSGYSNVDVSTADGVMIAFIEAVLTDYSIDVNDAVSLAEVVTLEIVVPPWIVSVTEDVVLEEFVNITQVLNVHAGPFKGVIIVTPP